MYREDPTAANEPVSVRSAATRDSGFPRSKLSVDPEAKQQAQPATVAEARVAALRVLASTLLSQVESLERQIASDQASEFSLQQEVHRFEAAIIRNVLAQTGGRQRRAARLLGVKVTTLNTKIKRLKIQCGEEPRLDD